MDRADLFPRLSVQDKAKLVADTSCGVWPFEAMIPDKGEVPPPEG